MYKHNVAGSKKEKYWRNKNYPQVETWKSDGSGSGKVFTLNPHRFQRK